MRISKKKRMDKKIYIRGGGYRAAIDPLRGANCISLSHESGASLLREPPKDGILDNPYLYGMPILFPVNRISGGSFEFEEDICTIFYLKAGYIPTSTKKN
jgi:galactose mutarotase-like enzyme